MIPLLREEKGLLGRPLVRLRDQGEQLSTQEQRLRVFLLRLPVLLRYRLQGFVVCGEENLLILLSQQPLLQKPHQLPRLKNLWSQQFGKNRIDSEEICAKNI